MGKLDGKIAVITAATSGMALETAKLFVQEGAYVFITGRQQDKLDEAVHLIGSNVTGVQGDASITGDLDRLYETVKKEKGHIDIVFASAGLAGFAAWLCVRGTVRCDLRSERTWNVLHYPEGLPAPQRQCLDHYERLRGQRYGHSGNGGL